MIPVTRFAKTKPRILATHLVNNIAEFRKILSAAMELTIHDGGFARYTQMNEEWGQHSKALYDLIFDKTNSPYPGIVTKTMGEIAFVKMECAPGMRSATVHFEFYGKPCGPKSSPQREVQEVEVKIRLAQVGMADWIDLPKNRDTFPHPRQPAVTATKEQAQEAVYQAGIDVGMYPERNPIYVYCSKDVLIRIDPSMSISRLGVFIDFDQLGFGAYTDIVMTGVGSSSDRSAHCITLKVTVGKGKNKEAFLQPVYLHGDANIRSYKP